MMVYDMFNAGEARCSWDKHYSTHPKTAPCISHPYMATEDRTIPRNTTTDLGAYLEVRHDDGHLGRGDGEHNKHHEEEAEEVVELILPDRLQSRELLSQCIRKQCISLILLGHAACDFNLSM